MGPAACGVTARCGAGAWGGPGRPALEARAGAVRVSVAADPRAAPATGPASQAAGTIRVDACRAPVQASGH